MTTIQPTIGAAPSGYAAFDSYFAQRSLQGERVHYAITLPLTQVPLVLPIPNPLEPFEDNRQVHEGQQEQQWKVSNDLYVGGCYRSQQEVTGQSSDADECSEQSGKQDSNERNS